MKKSITLLVIGVLVGSALCTANLMAGTIKANGYNWKDVYSFLANTVTLANEIKTDHNALVATHNATFNHYTGLRYCLKTYTSATTMRSQVSARALPTGTSTATTSATSLSLTQ